MKAKCPYLSGTPECKAFHQAQWNPKPESELLPSILTEASSIIHGDRNVSYGKYERECERIAGGWSLILGTEVQPRHVPLMMIWLKTSRELHKHKRDNLVDLCGYAALLEEMEEEMQ